MTENYDQFVWLLEARRKISKRFGHDVRHYGACLREREKELPVSQFVKIETPASPNQSNRSSNAMSDSHDLIQRIVSESRELSFRMRVDLIRRLASDTLEFMDARLESGDIEHDELNESIFLRRFVTETDDWSYDSFENSDIPF